MLGNIIKHFMSYMVILNACVIRSSLEVNVRTASAGRNVCDTCLVPSLCSVAYVLDLIVEFSTSSFGPCFLDASTLIMRLADATVE